MAFRCLSVLLLALLPTCDAPVAPDTPAPGRPNIVLIIGDDLGWPDYGFMGSEVVRTPNLDRLAQQGVVFSHAFNPASSCRPSLLALLTGLHVVQIRQRLGRDDSDPRLSLDLIQRFTTLPRLLSEHGYSTFQGGKWWEGSYRAGGFTHGMTNGPQREGGAGLELGRTTMAPLWDFLDAQREGPFFVWFAPMLPHAPFDAPEEYLSLYGESDYRAPYFANITRLDARVGELLDRLDVLHLREQTLVVYLADNGWDVASPPERGRYTLAGGPKGKSSIHELGFRTPLIFRWPGVLTAGRRERRLVSTVDLFPTLLDFASVPAPTDRPGRSLQPFLVGAGDFERKRVLGGMFQLIGGSSSRPGVALGTTLGAAWFLRTDRWRYIWFPASGHEELYRIDEDPYEERDLARARPWQLRSLRRRLRAWVHQAQRGGEAP